jgi:hypothetical protein
MRRCVSRVESNMLVAGVDVFYRKPLFVYFLWHGIVRLKRSRPTLRNLVRETGSALDVWLIPHMRLVDAMIIVVMGFTMDVGNHNIIVVAFRR